MKILFLTRKDSKHPAAGGAEKVVHEYAKGLVALGHEVTWFAYGFAGGAEQDEYDGIRIIRKFRLLTSYLLFPRWYKKHLQGKFDVVIDEAGGLPFLSPLFEKTTPIYLLAHHIGDKERDYSYPWPLSVIGKWVYRQLFTFYRKVSTITVSESTRQELIQDFSFDPDKIHVIENVCDIEPLARIDQDKKQKKVLFLGRLMPIKRVEDAIKAFAHFIQQGGNEAYQLTIVGKAQDKSYAKRLQKLIKSLSLGDKVHFAGYIAREEFVAFIGSHEVMLVPSMKEGFGLVVLEANSYGVPVIGYDVAGLRDSIQHGVNGLLVTDGDWQQMGQELKNLTDDGERLQLLSQSSLDHVKSLPNWEVQVKKLEKILLS